jgi:hypothetical protein
MKKGQGLPITTIVIAALALLVLVILFAIFTGRMGSFTKTLVECQGQCVPADQCQVFAREGECKSNMSVRIIPGVFNSIIQLSPVDYKCCLITK